MSGSVALGDFQSGDGATALQGKIPRFCVVRTGEFIVASQKLTTNDGERSIFNGKVIHHSYTSRCGIEEGLF